MSFSINDIIQLIVELFKATQIKRKKKRQARYKELIEEYFGEDIDWNGQK